MAEIDYLLTIKLVTIYIEAALESRLVTDIEKLGATGYNAHGNGH